MGDGPECGGAGAEALHSVAPGCRSCMKLRIRLENEERARVKAQEQLAHLHSQNLSCRNVADDVPGTPDSERRRPPSAGRCNISSPLDDVARSLETYRREVALLQEALRDRDA